MYRTGDLSLGQTLMAANAPMMIQEAMVEGRPADGILPSGQVAGLIDDLPTVDALMDRIISEARTSSVSVTHMIESDPK
jgi:NAD(P)H-dependent flavin oxidoreductase YrpB (nitropropane dioxygenase family)